MTVLIDSNGTDSTRNIESYPASGDGRDHDSNARAPLPVSRQSPRQAPKQQDRRERALSAQGDFSLQDRYTTDYGQVLLSGVQALVRALLTRQQLDCEAGFNIGGFVSGYRGSPLGGLDKELWAEEPRLRAANIRFQPGVNEDLAATAVWGSQHVGLRPDADVDGAFGLWYGKAPGLDRSGDAIRHANAAGTSAKGGVLLVVGDDPAAKSSSLATQSEHALQALGVPVLSPSDVQEVHDFAVLGWALSRHCGCWVALKAIADQMDSAAVIDVTRARFPSLPPPAEDLHIRLTDTPLQQEERLIARKLPAVVAAARMMSINRWVTRSETRTGDQPRLGIVTAGQSYRDVREALRLLGLGSIDRIRTHGIEILKFGLTWPLDEQLLAEFAESVDEILVVEEKREFIEPQIKSALYCLSERPIPVHGKRHHSGSPLLKAYGTISVAHIARALIDLKGLTATGFIQQLDASEAALAHVDAPAQRERTPLFCAGCPHNTSTRVPDGSRAVAGIGCHYMVQWMDRATNTFTQMGGEGVTWVGEAPFTHEKHIFANLGDGTYFHSGLLAIRQAVAADVSMTYKILFNDAVAMTGGQPMDGELTVAKLVQQLEAEGVAHVCVVSDEPHEHDALSARVPVYSRDELDAVQRELRDMQGVSVLIYQQACATELRRKRKRGLIEDDKPRLMINEAICDGCGDCSAQSNCIAVEPVETDQGTKRRINQTMCNKDLSCAEGYCPAFVEVHGEMRRPATRDLDIAAISSLVPQPSFVQERTDAIITGVGGTGIVTLSALIAVAAKIDGKAVRTLDMTGLAQKGGAVFSHVRIAPAGEPIHTAKIAAGQSDLLIACDLVTAASNEALGLLGNKTLACVNTHVSPTADFVLHQDADLQLKQRLRRVDQLVGELQTIASADSVITHLGDTAQANVFLLGYAYQSGRIALTLDSMQQALRVNGVQVERNLLAFHLGRLAQSDPQALRHEAPSKASQSAPSAAVETRDLPAVIARNIDRLTEYDGVALGARYLRLVEHVKSKEQGLRPGAQLLTRAVAESFAKLLAVKDEYEIARLYISEEFTQRLAHQFATLDKVRYVLAPPVLGTKKRRFGPWIKGAFHVLSKLRFLRNSWLDPFAYTAERRRELWLIEHFESIVTELVAGLSLSNHATAVEIAKLPQSMRGFGHVKRAQVDAALSRERELLEVFRQPPSPVHIIDPRRSEAA
jgi:indolepyruvate ferredoxin oxidoreductase